MANELDRPNDAPLFDPKHTARILRRHLFHELHDLQQRILLVERFGPHAVPWPRIQEKLGSLNSLEELKAKHADYVYKIERLTAAIDKADEVELARMVASIMARHRK